MAESIQRDSDKVVAISDTQPEDFADAIKEMTIHEKLWSIMEEVGGQVEQDGTVIIKGSEAYKYVSHDAVAAHLRATIIKYRVMVVPTVQDSKTDGNRTELTIDADFVNVDKPGDKVTVRSVGYGVDNSDKGPGKAWSYALKYAYLKLFMLNTADDIEAQDIQHEPETPRQAELTAQMEETVRAREAWAYGLRDEINGCEDLDKLKQIKKTHSKAMNDAPIATQAYFNAEFEKRENELKAKE